MICSSARITRIEGSDRSTSIASHSRLKSSSTLNNWKLRPSLSCSCMKSIDQTWLMDLGTASGSGRVHDALPGLDAKVQFQLSLDTVNPIVVPPETLDVAQAQEAQTKAPAQ
jgi:hypothetical protein